MLCTLCLCCTYVPYVRTDQVKREQIERRHGLQLMVRMACDTTISFDGLTAVLAS